MKTYVLKGLLADLWKPSVSWRLVPLGKGYFDIHFGTEHDLRRVWGWYMHSARWSLSIIAWKPDFVPGDVLPQTHVQLWVMMYGLSQDYWHPRHLMEIARGLGTPLQLDKATKEHEFGYYARVLVDVDLANELPSSLMVEREAHCFPIEIVCENMCSYCGMVGHMTDRCRQLQDDPKPCHSEKPISKPKLRDIDEGRTIEDNGSDIDERRTIKDNRRVSTPDDKALVPRPCTPTSSENQFVILAQEAMVGAANELTEQLADQVFQGPNSQTLDVENSMVVTNEALDDVEDSFLTPSTRTEDNAIVVREPEDDEFGDVNIMVEKSFDDLHIIQLEIASLGPSDDLLSRESVASAQVHEALLLQEKFLCDKDKMAY
ncbi:uncharacterized protein LOC126787003 [Argentina anserina]|uniref:uncharacterized protein LOC126787003 n=1 Tax=Argentina anserina TaxID=57926 RepID=UPI0021766DB3|nr:uncharacterized protein LOC126787003 [Potentilla anserina]